MKLATLMVLTPDVVEARRFYEGLLGFRVVAADDDLIELEYEGAAFHVFRCERAGPEPQHGRDAATVAVFGVASIEAAMAELKAGGVRFLHPSARNRFGRYAAFEAPGGNVHELFEAD